jgi:hypothetical protein
MSRVIVWSSLFFFALAAPAQAAEQFDFRGLQKVIAVIIDWMLILAPALITLSFVWAALLWTLAGHNKVMVEKARRQFIATCVCVAVIGGFFLIKGLIYGLAIGSFEDG